MSKDSLFLRINNDHTVVTVTKLHDRNDGYKVNVESDNNNKPKEYRTTIPVDKVKDFIYDLRTKWFE